MISYQYAVRTLRTPLYTSLQLHSQFTFHICSDEIENMIQTIQRNKWARKKKQIFCLKNNDFFLYNLLIFTDLV